MLDLTESRSLPSSPSMRMVLAEPVQTVDHPLPVVMETAVPKREMLMESSPLVPEMRSSVPSEVGTETTLRGVASNKTRTSSGCNEKLCALTTDMEKPAPHTDQHYPP